MLEVKNVTIKYGSFTAVQNLDFTLKPGEIFGLLGSNGSGKTTTFRMIMGLLEPFSGEVLLNGKKIGYDEDTCVRVANQVKELVEEGIQVSVVIIRSVDEYPGLLGFA